MLFSDILWLQQWCEEPYVICLIHCWIKTLQQQQLRYTIQKYRNCNVSIHYTAVADTMMRPCRPISSYNAGCSKNRHHFVQPLIFFFVFLAKKKSDHRQERCWWSKWGWPAASVAEKKCPNQVWGLVTPHVPGKKKHPNIPEIENVTFKIFEFSLQKWKRPETWKLGMKTWRMCLGTLVYLEPRLRRSPTT